MPKAKSVSLLKQLDYSQSEKQVSKIRVMTEPSNYHCPYKSSRHQGAERDLFVSIFSVTVSTQTLRLVDVMNHLYKDWQNSHQHRGHLSQR